MRIKLVIQRLILSLVLFFALSALSEASQIDTSQHCALSVQDLSFNLQTRNLSSSYSSFSIVTVTCTFISKGSEVYYELSLAAENNAEKILKQGDDSLEYNLFLDPACTLVFGDGTAGSKTISEHYINRNFTETRQYVIYGKLYPTTRQTLAVGNYTNSVKINLKY